VHVEGPGPRPHHGHGVAGERNRVGGDPGVGIGATGPVEAGLEEHGPILAQIRPGVPGAGSTVRGLATVHFTRNLHRHVDCPPERVDATTVREALDAYFRIHPAVRGYVLDEHGGLRTHMNVFVDGTQVADRTVMDDPVAGRTEIHVIQALSGG